MLERDNELVRFFTSLMPKGVRIVTSESKGLSNARNAGVRHAHGDVVAFIDDDAVADRDWLKNLIENYNDDAVKGAGGRIVPLWASGRPVWFPSELDWIVGCTYEGFPERKVAVRNTIGCNMSFRKDVFEIVGYFNNSFGRQGDRIIGSEETEFSARLLMRVPNSEILYDPTAVVYHRVPRPRATVRFLARRSFYEGFSKAMMRSIDWEGGDILSLERKYLKHIISDSIPSRLKQVYKPDQSLKLVTLLLSVCLVLTGYVACQVLVKVRHVIGAT